jgi:hypothetical protein
MAHTLGSPAGLQTEGHVERLNARLATSSSITKARTVAELAKLKERALFAQGDASMKADSLRIDQATYDAEKEDYDNTRNDPGNILPDLVSKIALASETLTSFEEAAAPKDANGLIKTEDGKYADASGFKGVVQDVAGGIHGVLGKLPMVGKARAERVRASEQRQKVAQGIASDEEFNNFATEQIAGLNKIIEAYQDGDADRADRLSKLSATNLDFFRSIW